MATQKTSAKQKYPQPVKENRLALKHQVRGKTEGQKYYLQTLAESTITLCTGPAGCGKTWLVTAIALQKLISGEVDKIIVTKPIVEAGDEELGFLKGSVEEKVLPHFESILDAIEDHIGVAATKKLLEEGLIKFIPVAFCRGRDFKDSFIIIDEAQNLTKRGIKLMMSRISAGSIMAINGDADQTDLKAHESGLMWAINKLKGRSEDIGVVELYKSDIQRHPLISLILDHLVL